MSEQMKLSEAIRLGGMMRPQAFGVFYDRIIDGVCALGAALDVCGALNKDNPIDGKQNHFLAERFPIVKALHVCPQCGSKGHFHEMLIAHLNDTHRWTREQIADWVESIEHAQTTQAGKRDDASMEPALAVKSEAL